MQTILPRSRLLHSHFEKKIQIKFISTLPREHVMMLIKNFLKRWILRLKNIDKRKSTFSGACSLCYMMTVKRKCRKLKQRLLCLTFTFYERTDFRYFATFTLASFFQNGSLIKLQVLFPYLFLRAVFSRLYSINWIGKKTMSNIEINCYHPTVGTLI